MQYDSPHYAVTGAATPTGAAIGGKAQRYGQELPQAAVTMELEHTIGFSAIPHGIFYHPSGQDYIYPTGGSICLSSFQDAHSQALLRGHDAAISSMAMSRSGRFLASGERGRCADVLIWDYNAPRPPQTASAGPVYRFSEHDHGVAALAFSDDERLLCSIGTCEDGRLFIWDLFTGQICATHQKMSHIVTCVAFGGMARDVKRRDTNQYQFATGGHRLLQLWVLHPLTGELTMSRIEQSVVRDFTCLSFAPDQETLVAGSTSGDFAVVHIKTRRLLQSVPACSCGIQAIQFGSHGVVVGGGDGTVLLFSHNQNQQQRQQQPHQQQFVAKSSATLDAPISSLSLSASEDAAVVGTVAGSIFHVHLTAVSTRVLRSTLLFSNHASAVLHVCYAAGVSDRFATISRDCTVRIWDASDYACVVASPVVVDAGVPTSLQFSLDVLLSGWSDGCLRCHSSDTGAFVWAIDNAHAGGVTALVLSHNQRFIVSAGVSGEVRVWDIRRRDMVSHLKEHSMAVTCLALFQDDLHVVSCSRDRSILCWDLRHERRISSHIQRMGGINTVALSANQKLVLSAGQEKRISFWDLRIDAPVRVIQKAHEEEATCIAVAHTLPVFATGGGDRVVKLWDFQSTQLLVDGVGHSGSVRSLAFSPDDRQLVSVGDDGCIFVWNVYPEAF